MITAREIGPQRYRASYGRYFEDFNMGDVYEHRLGRTLTDHDEYSVRVVDHESASHALRRRICREKRVRASAHQQPTVACRGGWSDRQRRQRQSSGESGLERHQAHTSGIRWRHLVRGNKSVGEAQFQIAPTSRHCGSEHPWVESGWHRNHVIPTHLSGRLSRSRN